MSDLRQRLAAISHDRTCSDHMCSPMTWPPACWAEADAALAVFVNWLRSAADDYGSTLWADGAIDVANALTLLADEISPNGDNS